MIKRYNDCVKEYGSQYKFEKAIAEGKIFKIEEGIYSDARNVPEIAILAIKYPNAIFSGESAFYYHGLTDVVPEKYSLATDSKSAKIRDERICQIYVPSDIFKRGVEVMTIEGYEIRIYDKERMLIELLRCKKKMPYDLYKEILLKYRTFISDLQLWRIQEYADAFPKSKMIKKALEEEIL